MSDDDWGPWIEHDGSGCPLRKGTVVHGMVHPFWESDGRRDLTYQLHDGGVWTVGVDDAPETWDAKATHCALVARYRIRKPKGLRILEKLIADLPEPVGPEVPA